jgi:ABC-type glycerol-3-phosphate transport system substrate-binding protein
MFEENEMQIASEFDGLIRRKTDAKRFAELIKRHTNNMLDFTYGDDDLMGFRGGNTRLYYHDGYFWTYSSGYGWADQAPSWHTEDEIVNIIWYDRHWVNRTLKEVRKYVIHL